MNFLKRLYSFLFSSKIRYFSGSRPSILIIAPRLPEFDCASGDLRLLRITEILCDKYNVFYYNDWMWERFLLRGNFKYLRHLRGTGVDVVLSKKGLKKILENYELNGVVTEFYTLGAKYHDFIKQHQPSVPFILDTVDVHFLRERLMAETLGDNALSEQAESTRVRELDVYIRSDFIWTVSDLDRVALISEGIPGEKIHIVPNIHQVAKASPPLPARESKTLLFIGGFIHQPNVDAILFFHERIFPLIREKVPQVQVKIVGADPPESIRALAGPGITVTGFVPDTRPYLDSGTVSIVPLRFGAGMKGKVGEALAAGLPLVTTSIGAQGMSLVSGRDCMIFDQPEEFAAAVIRLLSEPELWRSLSENGRKFMQDNFGFEAVRNDLLSFFTDLDRHRS